MMISIGNRTISAERRKSGNMLLRNAMGIVLALVLSLLITVLIIVASGKDPVLAMSKLFSGAFGTEYNFGETIVKAIPLILTGLGYTICYRTGLSSMGGDGQVMLGGLLAAVAGIYFTDLPSIALIPVTLILAMLAGGLWAGIVGYLKAKIGVSEVISTIMMNYIAKYLLDFMVDVPMREPPGYYPQSSLLQESSWFTTILKGTRIHAGIFIALAALVIVYIILWKLPSGFRMRATGYNQIAAKTVGIRCDRSLIMAMALSGVFAGLAGGVELLAVHHRLVSGFNGSIGYDGLAVALLGGLHPAGVAVAGVFFAALRVGASTMQRAVQVPAALISVIQGLIVLFVLMQVMLSNYVIRIFGPKKKLDKLRKPEVA
ncbi:MAG: ABC transporter permease [Bacillota bacterium]